VLLLHPYSLHLASSLTLLSAIEDPRVIVRFPKLLSTRAIGSRAKLASVNSSREGY
jgi:hypothetical protein